MLRFRISSSIGATAFGLILAAAPAEALNTVSYVSFVTGSSSNSCASPATACRGIADALSKTEHGGEIKCLDNHADSHVTIDKPITLDCGAPGSLLVAFNQNPSITVDLDEATFPDGVVTLRNLSFNGFLGSAITPGSDGIRIVGGGAAVHIEDSTIEGFAQQGIDFRPTSSVNLFVRIQPSGTIPAAASGSRRRPRPASGDR